MSVVVRSTIRITMNEAVEWGLVVVQQRGQIRWCACAKNFVSESSYFKLDS